MGELASNVGVNSIDQGKEFCGNTKMQSKPGLDESATLGSTCGFFSHKTEIFNHQFMSQRTGFN